MLFSLISTLTGVSGNFLNTSSSRANFLSAPLLKRPGGGACLFVNDWEEENVHGAESVSTQKRQDEVQGADHPGNLSLHDLDRRAAAIPLREHGSNRSTEDELLSVFLRR
ncbi:hypothetical protein EYF80_006401 [Liparis tanakae]|uniref:Uncharacterized protein n=1 Tax=Liparis tanakae TaxID=230148 RepID=A0A4Z2IZJ9_9TELE|nr:hypothetical protein EYF80_006401 [Liparis tanakae]